MRASPQSDVARHPLSHTMQRSAAAYPLHPENSIPSPADLSGGNAYEFEVPSYPMFGNDVGGGGQHVMDVSGGNSIQCGAAQTWVNPYSNPELEYVYLGSPQNSQSSPQNSYPQPGNGYRNPSCGAVPQPNLLVRPISNSPSQLNPPQQFGCPQNYQYTPPAQPPVSHGPYGTLNDNNLQQYDNIWQSLESDFIAQTSVQYDAILGDNNMVEVVDGFHGPPAHVSTSMSNEVQHTSRLVADHRAWAMPSNPVPGDAESSGSVPAGYVNTSSSTSSRQPQEFNPSHGFAGQGQVSHHPEMVRGSNPRFQLPPMEVGSEFMDVAMEDAVSDTVSTTVTGRNHAAAQRTSRPKSQFGNQMQISHHQHCKVSSDKEAAHPSRGSSFNESEPTVDNDLSNLMVPGQSGLQSLGEPSWAVQLLNLCAAAIASQNVSRTQHLMWVLNDLASVVGDANQRFAAYGLRALFCRITGRMEAAKTYLRPRHYDQELSLGPKMVHRALVKFHEHVPWHQNCYSVMSQTLLEVCGGKSRLHIIDIGAGKGIEWPIFIDALVSRSGGPPSILRMTLIRDLQREEHNLRSQLNSESSDFMTRLVKFAGLLGLHVEVNMVRKALECVTHEDLKLREGELLAVVCQFRLHRLSQEPDTNCSPPRLSPRDKFLDFIFKLKPHVFIQSDNDSDHCSPDFLTRFQNAAAFWWNCFESIDFGYNGRDPDERQIIEYEGAMMLLNMVACEGIARIERNESYQQWTRRITRVGFVPREISEETKKVAQNLVANHIKFWGVTFVESNMVSLLWRNRPTTFTSVWKIPSSCPKSSCKCSKLHS